MLPDLSQLIVKRVIAGNVQTLSIIVPAAYQHRELWRIQAATDASFDLTAGLVEHDPHRVLFQITDQVEAIERGPVVRRQVNLVCCPDRHEVLASGGIWKRVLVSVSALDSVEWSYADDDPRILQLRLIERGRVPRHP